MILAAPAYQRPHETVGQDRATLFSAWHHLFCWHALRTLALVPGIFLTRTARLHSLDVGERRLMPTVPEFVFVEDQRRSVSFSHFRTTSRSSNARGLCSIACSNDTARSVSCPMSNHGLPRLRAVLTGDDAESIVLDFVKPYAASRRQVGLGRKAWLDEAGR
jgi:hypothetical protein